LQRRSELFGDRTSVQLQQRAIQIAKGLVDIRFKKKFKKKEQLRKYVLKR